MPYLHYEKRCDQAKIYQVIKQINCRNSHRRDLGECEYPLQLDEVTSSQNECDDGAASFVVDSEDSDKLANLPSAANLAQDFEEDEERRTFLRAEKDLIRGYLGPQGPLHVSNMHQAFCSPYICFRDH